MARYEVLETSFINNQIVHPGAVVEYVGEASGNLRLLDEAPTLVDAAGQPIVVIPMDPEQKAAAEAASTAAFA